MLANVTKKSTREVREDLKEASTPPPTTKSMIASFSERIERSKYLRAQHATQPGSGAAGAAAHGLTPRRTAESVDAVIQRARSLSPRYARPGPVGPQGFGYDVKGVSLEGPKSMGRLLLDQVDEKKTQDEMEILNLRRAVDDCK